MKYPHIMQAVFGTPWCIEEEKLHAIVEFMNHAAFDDSAEKFKVEQGPSDNPSAAAMQPQYQRSGAVAILPIYGIIVPRANMMSNFSGGTSIGMLRHDFRAALQDEDIRAILLDFDTPGGSVHQVQEMADEIHAARSVKPIIAQISIQAASAGYWLASAAAEINISPSAEAGSIGALAMHIDKSQANEKIGIRPTYITAGRFKAEGNPNEPLSDAALEHMTQRVEGYYQTFLAAVARGRGTGVETVRAEYGQGRIYGAVQALGAGMVDRISTMDQTLARLRQTLPGPKPKRNSKARTLRARTEFPGRVL
ncbi:MAG: S49 family peptidase [bacterium]|nr:S49 family peptidase [bacterium]